MTNPKRNKLSEITLIAGSIAMVILILILSIIAFTSCTNSNSSPQALSEATLLSKFDSVSVFNIDYITDMTYIPATKTFWIECGAACEHYTTKDVFYELLWDINNPDSIHHTYYVVYNTDGESEILYLDL